MSYHDMPAFMHKLSTVADQSARAIEIPLLTVARTHEIQNMRWSQLDLDQRRWDIIGAGVETAAPGEMEGGTGTKNNNNKRTPFQRQALATMYEKRFPWARPRRPDVEQHHAEGAQGNFR
jgi:integrase